MTHHTIPTFTGTLSGHAQTLVDARDLHAHLEVETVRFNDWIKRRIEQYGFIDGEDFYSNLSKTEKSTVYGLLRGRPKTDYHLSLEMAKELALVENNARGREIRRALIALEREARERLPRLEAENAELRRMALATNPLWADLARYQTLGLSHAEIGRLVGKSAGAVRHQLRRLATTGLLDYRPDPKLAAAGRRGAEARQLSLLQGGGQ